MALPVKGLTDTVQRENNWLTNEAQQVMLNSPGNVMSAMGRTYRAFLLRYISDHTFKLLYAALKELRVGREAEATRQTLRDLGMPFVGLTLTGPKPEKKPNGAMERSDENVDR